MMGVKGWVESNTNSLESGATTTAPVPITCSKPFHFTDEETVSKEIK